MRVDLISFLNPDHYAGGGEQVSRKLIEVGRSRGHDIRISSERPRQRNLHDRPDLTLFVDLFNHGHSYRSLGAWRGFTSAFLEHTMKRAPFVHFSNAYVDICNLPYLPCSGHAAPRCPCKTDLSLARRILMRDFSGACFATNDLVRRLHTCSALDVFVSPLHKSITETIIGEPLAHSFVMRPSIDTTLFRDQNKERDIDNLFVGVIGEAKGLAALRERFGATGSIHLIGRIAPGETLDFGHHVGHVPYSEIPAWMSRAKNFVFLPRWPEPQGRVVCEAALSGCTIVGNQNVGALSFDFDLSDPACYEGAEAEFWQNVEALR